MFFSNSCKGLPAERHDRNCGTNWPRPDQIPGRPISEVTPYHKIDKGNLLHLLGEWCPDANTRQMILVDTPQRLYRFA